MEYFLTEEQRALQELARKVAVQKVKPVAAQYDREGKFPWDMVEEFRKAGFFRVYLPEEYG
ncbi:MAG: acyl-CoA dehydrogenase family protein, partial [bacterium]